MYSFGPGLNTRHLHPFASRTDPVRDRASNRASLYYYVWGGFIVCILDLLFPKRCVGCGRIGKYFCVTCAAGMRPVAVNECICPMCGRGAIDGITHPRCRTRYGLDGLSSVFHYQGVVRRAVTTMKYRLVTDIAREFVDVVPDVWIDAMRRRIGNDSVLMPIPLHPSRIRERGFNQADILGKFLCVRIGIAPVSAVIERKRKTVAQVAMTNRSERIANLAGAFGMRRGSFRSPASVVLFDDVFTTGATMREAANVLKRNGTKFVWAVTMAR